MFPFDGLDRLCAVGKVLRPKVALISSANPKGVKTGPSWTADASHQLPFFDLHIRSDVMAHAGAFLARPVAVACANQEGTRCMQTNCAVPAVQAHHPA
jgi:hypothetical protein